jgi:hypothetical protein
MPFKYKSEADRRRARGDNSAMKRRFVQGYLMGLRMGILVTRQNRSRRQIEALLTEAHDENAAQARVPKIADFLGMRPQDWTPRLPGVRRHK